MNLTPTNTSSRHKGYFHSATQWSKRELGAALPMFPWTSDAGEARKIAQAEANSNGYPVVVFWCDLLEGKFSQTFRVKPNQKEMRG